MLAHPCTGPGQFAFAPYFGTRSHADVVLHRNESPERVIANAETKQNKKSILSSPNEVFMNA